MSGFDQYVSFQAGEEPDAELLNAWANAEESGGGSAATAAGVASATSSDPGPGAAISEVKNAFLAEQKRVDALRSDFGRLQRENDERNAAQLKELAELTQKIQDLDKQAKDSREELDKCKELQSKWEHESAKYADEIHRLRLEAAKVASTLREGMSFLTLDVYPDFTVCFDCSDSTVDCHRSELEST
jgi:hypothetical protein